MRTTTSFTAFDHIPEPIRAFAGRRVAEVIGAAVLVGLVGLGFALLTWSVQDPSLNHATSAPVHNWLGAPGAIAADLVMQMFGIASIAILMPVVFWGWRLVTERRLPRLGMRLLLLFLGALCASGVAAILPVTAHWPLPTGLGGVLGDIVMAIPRRLLGGGRLFLVLSGLGCGIGALLALSASVGLRTAPVFDDEDSERPAPRRAAIVEDDDDADGEPGFGLLSLGALIHAALSLKSALKRWLRRLHDKRMAEAEAPAPWSPREPGFDVPLDLSLEPLVADASLSAFDANAYAPPALRAAAQAGPSAPELGTARVIPAAPAPIPGARALRETKERPDRSGVYVLPQLAMLTEAKRQQGAQISEDALQQNARLLEGVLDDFGVKGEIINVRPGPVVTLYELEPAPGIKSSRVIGLADDIARSMSAVSAD